MKKKSLNFLYLYIILFFSSASAQELDRLIQINDQVITMKLMSYNNQLNGFTGKDGSLLVITANDFDEKTAKKLMKNKLIQLKLHFAPQAAAYAGMVTKGEDCIKTAFFPAKIEQNKLGSYWVAEMPAASDYTVGNCGSKKDVYWKIQQTLYCNKGKKMFELSYYTKKFKQIAKPLANCSDL